MKIAVLLSVYNRKKKTLACLSSLYKQKTNEDMCIDVFMTEDGCTDGTVEEVEKEYSTVHIVHGDGNLFWNRGMLKAWKTALNTDKYDFFVWLNDDTTLVEYAIMELLETSQRHGDLGIIVGATQSDKNNTEISYSGRKADRKHTLVRPDSLMDVRCETFNGNIVLIPKIIEEKIGILDPYFHHSFGDIEYGLRATKAGIPIWISKRILGYCKRNNPIPVFQRKCYSLIKRFKLLYSPYGFNPLEDYHLNKKYYPWYMCILWFVKLHVNVFFTKDHTKY